MNKKSLAIGIFILGLMLFYPMAIGQTDDTLLDNKYGIIDQSALDAINLDKLYLDCVYYGFEIVLPDGVWLLSNCLGIQTNLDDKTLYDVIDLPQKVLFVSLGTIVENFLKGTLLELVSTIEKEFVFENEKAIINIKEEIVTFQTAKPNQALEEFVNALQDFNVSKDELNKIPDTNDKNIPPPV